MTCVKALQRFIRSSVATVTTDAFQKRLNYDAKEISQNRENICGDKTHQKLGGLTPVWLTQILI
jgi:hypothetical protein